MYQARPVDPKHLATQGVIPNFCALTELFTLMIGGQLLALILTMVASWRWQHFWTDLGLISLYVQWNVLVVAGILCATRRWLNTCTDTQASWAAFAGMTVVLAALTETAYYLNSQIDANLLEHSAFFTRSMAIGGVVAALSARYLYVIHQWRKQIQAQANARVQMLQARIRPHFLFNCMNTIASLTRTEPAKAERVVEDLSDLFRVSLADNAKRQPLARELELVERYLNIEQLRLGTRLSVDMVVDAPLDAMLPPLILQPLVENAVFHGIEPLAGGGTVQIRLTRQGGNIAMTVQNPVASGSGPRGGGNRVALENIKERLQLWYGQAAKVAIEPDNGCFRVKLLVPYESVPA